MCHDIAKANKVTSSDKVPGFCRQLSLGQQQRGLGLPATLFVLIIIALLAVAITELERSSAQGVSVSMQSTRAFYAAESGLQSGLARLFNFVDPAIAANPTACIADFTLIFAVRGLQDCSAAITCTSQSVDKDADGKADIFFTVGSTGTCGTGDNTAVRAVEVRAR